jgi:hypothetical protein
MPKTSTLPISVTSAIAAKGENLRNIRTILGKVDDPLLPPNSVDAVLLMKSYHEVARPIVLLRHVRAAMRPGAA